jgi:DNA-binding MarR family transcriptional regulator
MPSSLETELKQGKPFAAPVDEAVVSIARTAALLEHRLCEVLRPHGITPTQFNVLRILRGVGVAGLCRNEVRDRMVAPVPDTTRLLDRMVELGWVSRDRDTPDRRFVTTRITAKGLDLLRLVDPVVAARNREGLGHLGDKKLKALIELLAEVRRAG